MSEEKKVDGRRATALMNLEKARQKKNELIKKGKEINKENAYQLEIHEQSDSENSESESEDEVMIIKPKQKQKQKQIKQETPKDDIKEQLEFLKQKLAKMEKMKTPKKQPKKSGTILNVSLPAQQQQPQKEETKQSQMLRNRLINF